MFFSHPSAKDYGISADVNDEKEGRVLAHSHEPSYVSMIYDGYI